MCVPTDPTDSSHAHWPVQPAGFEGPMVDRVIAMAEDARDLLLARHQRAQIARHPEQVGQLSAEGRQVVVDAAFAEQIAPGRSERQWRQVEDLLAAARMLRGLIESR